MGLGLILMTSFWLNYICRDPIAKNSTLNTYHKERPHVGLNPIWQLASMASHTTEGAFEMTAAPATVWLQLHDKY